MAYGMMRKPMKKMAKPISISMKKRLTEHAKLHKGGMASKHMKKMKICNKSIAKCDC